MLHLRPYQNEALASVREAYRAGKRRVLVSLPTGTGKTVVFAHFPRAFKMKQRLLVWPIARSCYFKQRASSGR